MAGKRVTVDEFIRILESFEDNVKLRADEVPYEILSSIKRFIVKTKTIDTGKLIVAFDYHEHPFNNGRAFTIDTSNDPDRYGIEGFTDQPRPAYNLPGRFYVRQGIEAANIQSVFDDIAVATFQ